MGSLFLPNTTIKQSFSRRGGALKRVFSTGVAKYLCRMESSSCPEAEPGVDWAISYLRGIAIQHPSTVRTLQLVDLFCGAGGLTYGMFEAARSMGVELRPRVALDLDEKALDIYQRNMGVDAPLKRDVQRLIDYKVSGTGYEAKFAYTPTILDPLIHDLAFQTDLVVAGPPCRGIQT
jgi:hypothetical protein